MTPERQELANNPYFNAGRVASLDRSLQAFKAYEDQGLKAWELNVFIETLEKVSLVAYQQIQARTIPDSKYNQFQLGTIDAGSFVKDLLTAYTELDHVMLKVMLYEIRIEQKRSESLANL